MKLQARKKDRLWFRLETDSARHNGRLKNGDRGSVRLRARLIEYCYSSRRAELNPARRFLHSILKGLKRAFGALTRCGGLRIITGKLVLFESFIALKYFRVQ